jgi:hypothetical protein
VRSLAHPLEVCGNDLGRRNGPDTRDFIGRFVCIAKDNGSAAKQKNQKSKDKSRCEDFGTK